MSQSNRHNKITIFLQTFSLLKVCTKITHNTCKCISVYNLTFRFSMIDSAFAGPTPLSELNCSTSALFISTFLPAITETSCQMTLHCDKCDFCCKRLRETFKYAFTWSQFKPVTCQMTFNISRLKAKAVFDKSTWNTFQKIPLSPRWPISVKY